MKVYICDSCGTVIRDPYKENVTEYVYSAKTGQRGKWRRTLHLCATCCQNLRWLAERLVDEE